MPFWTNLSRRPSARTCCGRAMLARHPLLRFNKRKLLVMSQRNCLSEKTNKKSVLTRQIYFRVSERDYKALGQEAQSRAVTNSKLVRSICKAHVDKTRAELPHLKGPSRALIREIARIGNNINQLTRQANAGVVTVSESDLKPVLGQLTAALRKL